MDISYEKFEQAKNFKMLKGYEKFLYGISSDYQICIFGCGLLGKQICTWLLENGIRPKFFCDNNSAFYGKEIVASIQCVSVCELMRHKDDMFVIVAVGNKTAIESINHQLKGFKHIIRNPLELSAYWCQTFDIEKEEFFVGIKYALDHLADNESKELYKTLATLRLQDRVTDYPFNLLDKYYYKNQYIISELIDYGAIKSYIDCGAYEGDSLERFIRLGTDASYYCFEMDHNIFEKLRSNVSKMTNKPIYLFPYGIGESTRSVSYISDTTGHSSICSSGTALAKIIPLDSIAFSEKIDFIKMDIEGAEENALKGATALIKHDHPILAISIYHNFSQFVNVIQIIKNLDPRYKIYIRHHKYTLDDTVCYAIYE